MSRHEPRSVSPIGTVLGGAYRLNRLVAEGGMGAVYEATHLRLDSRCAVKLMSRELAADAEALARFKREAKITSRLSHPHIVQISDFGTSDLGEPFLVMEFLDGEDLEARLRRLGRLTLPVAVHIVKQAASALGAIHGKGVIHRDLKPANLFLVALPGEADFVKVVDFGVSKLRGAATQITRAAVVMGTPNYMAPEQASGRVEDVDHRSDQWALACIAWEMLAGERPFVGADVQAQLQLILSGDPPPLRARDLPAAVEETLRRALAKDPARRFPTIAAFARAFEAAATPAKSEARSTSEKEKLKGKSQGKDNGQEGGWFTRQPPPPRKADAVKTFIKTIAPAPFARWLEPKKKPRRRWPWVLVALAIPLAGAGWWRFRAASSEVTSPPADAEAATPPHRAGDDRTAAAAEPSGKRAGLKSRARRQKLGAEGR